MRYLSSAALMLSGVLAPLAASAATIPAWDAGVPAQVLVPAGGTASVAARGALSKEGLDIALVMDTSGSMSRSTDLTAPGGGTARGDWARDGANSFLDALPDASRVALTEFYGRSFVRVPIDELGPLSPRSTHRTTLKTTIDRLSRNGVGTNIGGGIGVATQTLVGAGGAASKHIVLVTDGESTAGNATAGVDAAIAAGIAGVHTVGLPGASVNELRSLAQRGNGQFVDGTSLTSLISQFTTILDNVDAFSRLDILTPEGQPILTNVPLQSPTEFLVTLDVREGLNRYIARATSTSGAQRSAELVIEGIVVPESASVAMLAVGVVTLLGRSRRRVAGVAQALPLLAVATVAALAPSQAEAGLAGKVYESKSLVNGWALKNGIIDFSNANQVRTRNDASIDFWNGQAGYKWRPTRDNFYGVEWNGYLRVEVTGDYGIGTISDDGSQVWVNGSMVVNNSERQYFDWEDNLTETSVNETPTGPLVLSRGFHPIRVRFYEDQFWDGIELWWLPPGQGESRIPYLGTTFTDANSANHPKANPNTNWQIIPAESLYAEIPALDGDFNVDGIVDAADYTLLRDGLGSTYSVNDYQAWRDNFGALAGAGTPTPSIPEPSALAVGLVALTAIGRRQRG